MKTYKQTMDVLIEGLREEGWKISGPLKIRHATSPDKKCRIWFKAQAVYMTLGIRHCFKNARSMHILNIKNMSIEGFIRVIENWAK